MKFNELAKLVEQAMVDGAPVLREANDIPKGCPPQYKDAISQSGKYRRDDNGRSIAQLARDILVDDHKQKKTFDRVIKTEYGNNWKSQMISVKKAEGPQSQKASRTWTIRGSPVGGQNLERKQFTTELANELRANGIEAYAHDTDNNGCRTLPTTLTEKGEVTRVFFTMEDGSDMYWDFVYKPNKISEREGAIDATKFEGNLVYGFKWINDQESALEYQEKVGEAGGMVLSPVAIQSGIDVAEALEAQVKKAKGTIVAKQCRKSTKANYQLTELYAMNGVGGGGVTPKTDIFLSNATPVSVKKSGGAQWASSEGAEAVSIIQAALSKPAPGKDKPIMGSGQIKKVQNFLRQTMSKHAVAEIEQTLQHSIKGMTDDDRENKRALQKGASSELNFKVSGIEGSDIEKGLWSEKFRTAMQSQVGNQTIADRIVDRINKSNPVIDGTLLLAKQMELCKKKLKGNCTPKEAKKGFEAEARKILKNDIRELQADAIKATIGGISNPIRKILGSKDAKQAILREAVTGENKFTYTAGGAAPKFVLYWNTDDPSLSKFVFIDDKWIKKTAGDVKIDIRGEKGSGRDKRFAVNESLLHTNEIDPSLLLFEYLYEGEFSQYLDKGKELASRGLETAKKAAKAGYDFIEGGIKTLLNKLKELYEWIKKSINEVIDDVVNFVGELFEGPWVKMFGAIGINPGDISIGSKNVLGENKEKKDLTKQNITYKMLVETIEEEMRLMETANTLGADVNEILMGYYAGGENWNIYGDQRADVIQGLEQRKAQISPEEYADQEGRAKAQAEASLEWAAANGFDGKLVQTWWTARPGVLARAVETDVDSKKNPTDTLYKFSSDAFLGVSAKSTKGKGEIGFKNPGIGSLGKALGVDLVGVAKPMLLKVSEKLDWGDAKTFAAKKQYLKDIGAYPMPKGSRTPTPAGQPYYSAGHEVLAVSRDALMKAYLSMPIEDLKEHFLDGWIDAKDRYPYYIKVTGHGKNGNYTASVMDPLNNDKLKKISSEHIELEEVGLSSIGVWAGEGADATKLFKIRFKWESSPLSSGLKLSGEKF